MSLFYIICSGILFYFFVSIFSIWRHIWAYFPKVSPFLFPYYNLKSNSVGQILHYLLHNIKFEYIELHEILFYNNRNKCCCVSRWWLQKWQHPLTSHPILFNLHSLRDELIPIRKTTDRTIWWRYQITNKKEKTSKVHHS